MKVAITGHTRGIGKSLLEKFTAHNYEVVGFSNSTGFDIGDPITIKEILDFSLDCDIFINNAYHPTGQTLLLKEFMYAWKGTNKIIVNISSKSILIPEGFKKDMPWLSQNFMDTYVQAKQEQGNILKNKMFDNKPQTLNVITGIVDTDMANIFVCNKLKSAEVAELIYDLTQYSGRISIQEIIIDVPGLNWNDIGMNQ